MKEDGLLDFMFKGCSSRNIYCFLTEIVYWQDTQGSFWKFKSNPKLRAAIEEMLTPFEKEKPLFSIRAL